MSEKQTKANVTIEKANKINGYFLFFTFGHFFLMSVRRKTKWLFFRDMVTEI